MSTNNVVNPGVVNVADQGDGRLSVDQCVSTSPSQNAGPSAAGSGSGSTLGLVVNQPVTVGPSQIAQRTVGGDEYSPTSGNCINVTENNVAGQVFGTAFSPTYNV
jgi:hypothetical protein